jgi:hypothetical protein
VASPAERTSELRTGEVQTAEETSMAVTYYVALPFIRTDDGTASGEAQECQSEAAAIKQAEGMLSVPANVGAVAFNERSRSRNRTAAGALAIGSEPNTILSPIPLPQREIQTNFSSKHLAFLGFREGKDCQRERSRE